MGFGLIVALVVLAAMVLILSLGDAAAWRLLEDTGLFRHNLGVLGGL
jgi:hypothetical protein